MEEKLDFSLPDKKRETSFASAAVIILLLVLTGLTAANFFIRPLNRSSYSAVRRASLSPEQVKQLAAKLASRDLYIRAADVWQDYLAAGKLTDKKRAKTLFQIAALLEKAGQYDKAIEYYYRSETVAKIAELEPQINTNIKNCFEKLGKFSALRYELMDRTSFNDSAKAGEKTVAEIGPEKITEAHLDALIEEAIDNQLAPMAAFMTTDQLNEQKKKMLEQYKNPSTKQQFLQSWLAQEVLYRQALEKKLQEKPEARKLVKELTRSTLSQLLMNEELASKINITETDLQTYYQANKDRFIEPANEDANTPERQKTFDEARQQVTTALLNQKRQDVQTDLIKRLMDKYDVVLHSSTLMPINKSGNDK